MNLNEMARKMQTVSKQREKNGAFKPGNLSLLKHMATEVIEAAEAFFFFDNEIPNEPGEIYLPPDDLKMEHRQALAGELSDVIACALIIAANENIDIESALERCLYKNQLRAMKQGDKL